MNKINGGSQSRGSLIVFWHDNVRPGFGHGFVKGILIDLLRCYPGKSLWPSESYTPLAPLAFIDIHADFEMSVGMLDDGQATVGRDVQTKGRLDLCQTGVFRISAGDIKGGKLSLPAQSVTVLEMALGA